MGTATQQQLRINNHFVPRLSLKHFANLARKVCVYRTLVSNPNVPIWKAKRIGSIASIEKLYFRKVDDEETDEIEKWLDRDFEQPASEAIDLAVSDQILYSEHWESLINFVAAQIVRTPAFLLRRYPEWRKNMPQIVSSVLEQLAAREQASGQERKPPARLQPNAFAEYVPVRVSTIPTDKPDIKEVKVELSITRGYWYFVMRHVLTNTVRVLKEHRWSILKPCEGLPWFTSDDPVTALNRRVDGSYDFGGGWGTPGTEIFLPLSPNHLLYTCIGQKPLLRGTVLDGVTTQWLRRFIAEHAHRAIFAAAPDEEVATLHPREVSETRYREEQNFWSTFAEDQEKAEAMWKHALRT